MASKKKQQNLFKGAEAKLAAYEEKQRRHQDRTERRIRDNKLALIAGFAALLIAGLAQFGYGVTRPKATQDPSSHAAQQHHSTASASASAQPTNSSLVPNKALAEDRMWTGTMSINNQDLYIRVNGTLAPQAAANFITLAKKGFYNGLSCHRLTTSGIYVLQCGDPKGDGTGGPGYSFGPIENAPKATNGVATYRAGTIAMANSGSPYSNGSQFFIVYKDSPLAPNYTVFGSVTTGLEKLNAIIKAGVAGGGTDGKPAIKTTLGAIKLK